MRLALFTPRLEGWIGELSVQLARSADLVHVSGEREGAAAELPLYHVADRREHVYVYRKLLEEPGLVILEDWNLHSLVHAATAGRGDVALYRREARRAHGPLGSFTAEQVLRGWAGALPSLVPLNERVLAASLGLLARSEAVYREAQRRLAPQVLLRFSPDASESAKTLLARAEAALPGLSEARRSFASARQDETTPLGRALTETRPLARELGLGDVPPDVRPLLSSLFARADGVQRTAAGR